MPKTAKGPLPNPKVPIKGTASAPFGKGLPDETDSQTALGRLVQDLDTLSLCWGRKQPEGICKGMKWSLNPTQLRALRSTAWPRTAVLKGTGRGCEHPAEETRCLWGEGVTKGADTPFPHLTQNIE